MEATTVNEKPIIFSGEMVRAILEGRKTQTRQVVKPQPEMRYEKIYDRDWFWSPSTSGQGCEQQDLTLIPKCPYGVPGDELCPAIEILDGRYAADTHGRIWSQAKGDWRILAPASSSKGYLTVTPAVDGKYKTRLVHRLVAEAFYGPAPNHDAQVRHLDGDQTNNAPDNLDWGTQEDNWSDRRAHGKGSGESHHAAKLTIEQVREIRTGSDSQREAAHKYGVDQAAIWSIRNNKTWVESPEALPPNCPRWASRIQLQVTEIRVERLQEISSEDAISEGIEMEFHPGTENPIYPVDLFVRLWDSINGKPRTDGVDISWSANPWVWVVEFKKK